jgi:transposase-like protein
MTHGINANIVHRWRQMARGKHGWARDHMLVRALIACVVASSVSPSQ